MTAAELNTIINKKCGTNDTTFPVADKLVYVNFFIDEIASKIVERNNNFFLVPSTFDLVLNQREYAFGNDLLNRMRKLEIKFSSSDSRFRSNYIKDYYGSETESEIVKNFSNTEGEFAHTIRRRALFILSGTISAVTAGGRLWANVYPASLANLTDNTNSIVVDPSTTTFGFPRQFHELLARRVAIEYKSNKPKQIPLSPVERNYENDLQAQLNAIDNTDDTGDTIGEMPSSSDLWDDGWNL